jgi:hypothetical protein
MSREKLVEQLKAIREQEKEIRKQLDAVDYEEKFNDAKQYEGRYFKEANDHHKGSIRCLFVYATEKTNCTPMSLCVSYWEENETSYFDIEYYGHFHPRNWDGDVDKWVEIDKDEYLRHYNEVQKRISMAVASSSCVN